MGGLRGIRAFRSSRHRRQETQIAKRFALRALRTEVKDPWASERRRAKGKTGSALRLLIGQDQEFLPVVVGVAKP